MKIEKEFKIINQIESIRERNNKLWMNLLRIAMNKNPEGTKETLKEIGENDLKIYELNNKLAE
jgi:hypothetical protein